MTAKEKREEREYMKRVDAMLDHWEATQSEHDAEVARREAIYIASGERDRDNARADAIMKRTWDFERARLR